MSFCKKTNRLLLSSIYLIFVPYAFARRSVCRRRTIDQKTTKKKNRLNGPYKTVYRAGQTKN